MWEIDKAVLITNNDRVYEKYKETGAGNEQ